MTRNPDDVDTSESSVSRRNYLALAGASIPALAGLGVSSADAATQPTYGGPPNVDNWELTFEDDFDGTSLDTSNWGIGWGWGMGAPGAKVTWAQERHVNVENSDLVLTCSKEDWESDGVLYAGNVHSKDMVTVEPPVYFEARCKFIKGAGFQNAFWSKPNDEAWPPEIDVVEYLQTDDSTSHTSHNLHYSTSGSAGDSSTHTFENGSHSGYDQLPHESYHVYGFEWRDGALRHYVDGQVVEETTDPDILEAFANGGLEYLMLSLNLDNVGTTDKSISWADKEFRTDWVRVWKPSGRSGSSGGDGSDNTTVESHYLWARSGDGNEVSFDVTADPGNFSLDYSSSNTDYYVSSDGTTAGGTTSATGTSIPGFRFDGEITDLEYSGDLELYIDNTAVNPDDYTSSDSSDSTDATRHYMWVRSGDGNQISFEFAADPGDVEQEFTSSSADYWIGSDGDTAGGSTSSTGSGLPGFWYYGDLTTFTYEGDLDLFIDGQAANPDQFGDGSSSDGSTESLERSFTVDATRTGGSASYEIVVSDAVQGTDTTNSSDQISGTTVTGSVAGWRDGYTFSGSIESVSIDGDADLYVDGQRVDRLTVERDGNTGGDVWYLVEVTGTVRRNGGTLESSDDIDGNKILGQVGADADEYWVFDGDVSDVSTFGGDVIARVNGSEV